MCFPGAANSSKLAGPNEDNPPHDAARQLASDMTPAGRNNRIRDIHSLHDLPGVSPGQDVPSDSRPTAANLVDPSSLTDAVRNWFRTHLWNSKLVDLLGAHNNFNKTQAVMLALSLAAGIMMVPKHDASDEYVAKLGGFVFTPAYLGWVVVRYMPVVREPLLGTRFIEMICSHLFQFSIAIAAVPAIASHLSKHPEDTRSTVRCIPLVLALTAINVTWRSSRQDKRPGEGEG